MTTKQAREQAKSRIGDLIRDNAEAHIKQAEKNYKRGGRMQ